MRRMILLTTLTATLAFAGGYWLKITHDWNHYGERPSSRIYD